jgi:hypothetical protein
MNNTGASNTMKTVDELNINPLKFKTRIKLIAISSTVIDNSFTCNCLLIAYYERVGVYNVYDGYVTCAIERDPFTRPEQINNSR